MKWLEDIIILTYIDIAMRKTARNQFAMNTLYSVSAIGLGLFLFEGKPLVVAILAYGIGYLIARNEDYAD